jgi:hypothetical protein
MRTGDHSRTNIRAGVITEKGYMSRDMQPLWIVHLDWSCQRVRHQDPMKAPLYSGHLSAKAFLRLDLLQQQIDLLLALQCVEPAIDVVAQHIPFGPAQSFFARDF